MIDGPIRVGILIDNILQPAWAYSIIEEIQRSDIARVSAVICNVLDPDPEESTLARLWSQRKQLAYKLFLRLERHLFPGEPDAFALKDLQPLLGDCPIIRVQPIRKKWSDYFTDTDLDRILEQKLDVALRLGFRILRGKALQIAKHGVWSYHHDDNRTYRGGPPGFWEVVCGDPVTGSVLQQLTEELDGGKILYRSYAATDRRSVRRNTNAYYWKSARFVLRAMKRLHECGCPASSVSEETYHPYSGKIYKRPSNWEMLKALGVLGSRAAAEKVRHRLYRDQWMVAYKLTESIPDTFHNYRLLECPRDRFLADPFPFRHAGKQYIFCEELPFRRGVGHISVVPLQQDGSAEEPIKIIEEPYHLSYPMVFSWQGEVFLMPESARNKTLDVYRCERFPDRWVHDRRILENVAAADATLCEHEGVWWLFVNLGGDGYSKNDELFLFHSNTPFGPWMPHRRNPVKSDVRSARPAGKLFRYRGQLYRPAQDLSRGNRYRVAINRVERLNPAEYSETMVSELTGSWDRQFFGVHTLNHGDGLSVIDVMRRIRRV